MATFRDHIRRAISLKGNQSKLADAAGCSQQAISFLLNEADGVTVEMALKIERATDGQISRHELRPDVFGQSATPSTEGRAA